MSNITYICNAYYFINILNHKQTMGNRNTIGSSLSEEQVNKLKENAGANQAGRPAPVYRSVRVENKVNGIPESALRFPEHFVKIAMILKNNSEIRRFTSLAIINYLRQKEVIDANAPAHVEFKWNKFAVSSQGLSNEYSYKEHFFINCLTGSFTSFANVAQQTISDFINKECPDFVQETEGTNCAE